MERGVTPVSSARYVYAIVRRDRLLPTALAAAPISELAMVPWRELAAVTRLVPNGSPSFTMEAVLRHELVVEAVREHGPALPVRFGTVFRNAGSVVSALATRYELLATDLDRLGDKAELSLTALWERDAACGSPTLGAAEKTPSVATTAGAHYLRARAAELRHDEALVLRARSSSQKVDEALQALALDKRVSLVPTAGVAIRAAYLIDPAQLCAFRLAFETLRREHAELRMLLTGPWPPYSFVAPPEGDAFTAASSRVADLAQLLTDAMQERRG
jgi:hypothetical protein